MCGFAGEFVFAGLAAPEIADSMADTLNHRGPDNASYCVSADGQCAMAFRRLGIIDPQNSNQPMTDPSGRYTIVFNGEIYNFKELRSELERDGAAFRTAGDTEVLLQMLAKYGVNCIHKLQGMFAVVLYDNKEKKLTLIRDRIGKKPLFYAVLPDRIIFASEIKAFKKHPRLSLKYNRFFITHFLTIGYIHSPNTPFDSIKKLLPAHRAEISACDIRLRIFKYYSPGATIPVLPENPEALAKFLREKIINAVGKRLVSDVPLGLFLSSGIDSAVILAAMCEHMPAASIKTFTAGFDDKAYDERAEAAQLAKKFGTDHRELKILPQPKGMSDWIVDTFDEPFADSSAWPLYHICRAAREHITVALTGDGGDEVFGGYDRYRALHLAQNLKPYQYLGLQIAGKVAAFVAPHKERHFIRRFVRFTQALPYPPAVQYFILRRLFGPEDLAKLLSPAFVERYGINLDEPAEWFCSLFEQGQSSSQAVNAQHCDMATYLPDDLLVKSDRASMAASLELRSPMLDHELIDIGLALPVASKLNDKHGKLILQKAFGDVLPQKLFMRQKQGFGVPLAGWLRNELREELRTAFTDTTFKKLGIFDKAAVASLATEHVAGFGDHSHRLWALLVLAKWLAKNA